MNVYQKFTLKNLKKDESNSNIQLVYINRYT